LRAEIDDANDTLGKKISRVKTEKIPYYMVIGDKEAKSKTLKIENREGKSEELSLDKLIKKLEKEINSRT
jgi:threonyl-tRNA synthetase